MQSMTDSARLREAWIRRMGLGFLGALALGLAMPRSLRAQDEIHACYVPSSGTV